MSERKPTGPDKPMETASNDAKKPTSQSAKLSRDVQSRLGQQLRAMYDDVVSQGVPDRFTELLNRLDTDENKGKQ